MQAVLTLMVLTVSLGELQPPHFSQSLNIPDVQASLPVSITVLVESGQDSTDLLDLIKVSSVVRISQITIPKLQQNLSEAVKNEVEIVTSEAEHVKQTLPTLIRVFIAHHPKLYLESSVNDVLISTTPFASHIFYFTSPEVTFSEVATVMKLLWQRYQFLNIIARLPCSSTRMLVYKPFERDSTGSPGVAHLLPSSANLLLDVMGNLNGYPLRVSIFERYPTVLKELPLSMQGLSIYRNSMFYGVDGFILSELSNALNFQIQLDADSEDLRYGVVAESGNITGTLAQVVNRKIDLQVNSRYVINYDILVDYSTTVTFEYLNILVIKRGVIPKWLEIYRIFYTKTNIVAMAVWVICCCFNILIHNSSIANAVTEMYCIAIGHPQKAIVNSNKIGVGRTIFLANCLIFFMVLLPLFTAELTDVFTSAHWWPQINSLEEFDKSGMKIKSTFNPFRNDTFDITQRLSLKVDDTSINISSIDFMIQDKNYAAIERLKDAQIKIASKYTDQKGEPLLHIVPDYASKYFLAYIAPVGSPFLPVINNHLMKLHQFGLNRKWYKDFAQGLIADARMQHKRQYSEVDNTRGYKQFRLVDVQCLFYALLPGYVLSMVVFVVECRWKRMK